MNTYASLSPEERKEEYARVAAEFAHFKSLGLKLDMSRGKPSAAQLDLASELFYEIASSEDCILDGTDMRNYGVLDGISPMKAYFAELLGVQPAEVFVGGNASLQMMYDTIAKAYTHGLLHSSTPWGKLQGVKFLCPAPGYDRHFKISESFGMELITIPMTEEGPDMDAVEAAVQDPMVKGMWCVPKYSNPGGISYSDAVIYRLSALKPAAPDFLLMWDNAYCVHEFDGPFVPFPDILTLCREQGNADMPFEFASTSKISMPGTGVSVVAASEANIRYMSSLINVQTISYDKINQLRHLRYLKDKANTLRIMQQHATILKPKFHTLLAILDRELAPLGIASWSRPTGGYFVSLDTMPGCAKRTLALAKEAGVVMTEAGATFPYGKDPEDRNIRIAPSMPPVEELKQAAEILCVCIRMAALERMGV